MRQIAADIDSQLHRNTVSVADSALALPAES